MFGPRKECYMALLLLLKHKGKKKIFEFIMEASLSLDFFIHSKTVRYLDLNDFGFESCCVSVVYLRGN